jgi:hypothetical protein
MWDQRRFKFIVVAGLFRPSTSLVPRRFKDMDARDKPGMTN